MHIIIFKATANNGILYMQLASIARTYVIRAGSMYIFSTYIHGGCIIYVPSKCSMCHKPV